MTDMTMRPRYTEIDGLRIRYATSGVGRDSQALLLCPWPESLYAFHLVWPRLAEDAELLAVDLPGFGHSEGRESLMTPQAMGGFVVRVADAFGFDRPHVVGPDVGTAASLYAAADHPGRFRSLVVGSGGAVTGELGGVLGQWVSAPSVEPYRAMDPRAIVAAGVTTIEGYDLPADIEEDYLSAYDGDRFVRSMAYVRSYPEQLAALARRLPEVATPVQIIGGLWDFVVPPSNARFLHRRLPYSKLDLIDSGHFAWEENPGTYARLVTSWWGGGYRAASRDTSAAPAPR